MSKVRTALVLAAGLGLAAASQATAAPSQYKVTGGGQIFADFAPAEGDDPATVTPGAAGGAGDTITFNAQGSGTEGATDARGKVLIIEREAGTGKNNTKYMGAVNCVRVLSEEDGGGALIGTTGTIKRGTAAVPTKFTLYVTDGGEGAKSAGDTIQFLQGNEDAGTCAGAAPDDDDDNELMLSRGNVQIHKVRA